MYNIKKQVTWYGMYHSSLGDVIVIHDRRIVPSDSARIYLYHTQRNEFVEYVESIIASNLSDLNDNDEAQAESDYKQKWLDAITSQGMSVKIEKTKSSRVAVKKEKINWNKAKS